MCLAAFAGLLAELGGDLFVGLGGFEPLAAFAGLLAELGGDLFVGLGGFEPLNIIKSQVEFGVQPVGLRRFWGQCCKNAVGLPVGLAPPPSPTVFSSFS